MTTDTSTLAPAGQLVSWEEGIGDDKKYSIAHVSPTGLVLVPKMKDYQQWQQAVASAQASPAEAPAVLQRLPKSKLFTPDQISKVSYSKDLWQLYLFDREQNRTKVPNGKEQEQVFAAIKHYWGGKESEEEADAWSVVQTPLFILSVIAVIGGFFIWFCAISEPNYEASGRRSGMKQLLNSIGYTIGPVWMSVIVGTLAAITLASMISQLIKRPVKEVLEY